MRGEGEVPCIGWVGGDHLPSFVQGYLGVFFTKKPNFRSKIQSGIGGAGRAVGPDTDWDSVFPQKIEWKRLAAKPIVGCGAVDNRDPVLLQVGQVGGYQLISMGNHCPVWQGMILPAPLHG